MLEKGLKHISAMRVEAGNTAEYIGSGDMAVLATPAMVALMENAAMWLCSVVRSSLAQPMATIPYLSRALCALTLVRAKTPSLRA